MPDNEYEIGRKDYMEINLANIKTKMDGLHYTANLTELYRKVFLGRPVQQTKSVPNWMM